MTSDLLSHSSVWHAGEVTLQRSVGVAEQMAEFGHQIIRDHLIAQHRAFYPLLPFAALGAVDGEGDAWATLRAGQPGFLHSPDPHHLVAAIPRDPADPADAGMADGDAIGLLGIDLKTRRRNRLNGRIRRAGAGEFTIEVEQSFGNCPQYIQRRGVEFHRDPTMPSPLPARHLGRLDAGTRSLIAHADTFFVASYVERDDGSRQVDVSHRGGRPGFVRLDEEGTLTIPDFSGNKFFNTLGNMLANPRAGLVFIDFSMGDLLQLSGTTEILLDTPEIAEFDGAERLWRFTPRHIVHRPQALPLHWSFDEEGWSPATLATGVWPR